VVKVYRLVVRVKAPLMFANAENVRTRVRELAAAVAASPDGLRLVVLDGRTSPSIDVRQRRSATGDGPNRPIRVTLACAPAPNLRD
jgi:MFS superfamily sulfate permease-like transporter